MKSIYALSSAPHNSAIAIIRLSGDNLIDIARRVFSNTPKEVLPRMMYLSNLVSNDRVIDQVMYTYFKAPNSYTGEDMIEIYLHGNMAIVEEVYHLLSTLNLRIAERGEFTLRAYLNKKVNLLQAEAINELITNNSVRARDILLNNLSLATTNIINKILLELKDIISSIEVDIDYPEYSDIEKDDFSTIREKVRLIYDKLYTLESDSKLGTRLISGIKIALIGRANVGKSSLFNNLIGEEKALITAIPGTTRDLVDKSISIDGITYTFLDTAGIRKTSAVIESLGIKKTIECIHSADIIIFITDLYKPNTRDLEIIKLINDANKEYISVVSKSDLKEVIDDEKFNINNLDGLGIKELKEEIVKKTKVSSNNSILFSLRQISHLDNILNSLRELLLEKHLDSLIISSALQSVYSELSSIVIGEALDIESEIFSRFCVGK